MEISEILVGAIFGGIGGIISGSIVAFINPIGKWYSEKWLRNKEFEKEFIKNISIETEKAKYGTLISKIVKLNNINQELNPFFTKKEAKEIVRLKFEANKEMKEICDPDSKEFIDEISRPTKTKNSKNYFDFLEKTILRLRKKYNIE